MWILLIVAGLVSALAVLAAIVQHRGARRLGAAMERFETEIGTLDPLAHAPAELPDDDNAAYWLKQGARALSALSGAERLALNQLWEREGDPGPGVEALLERHQAALEHLRRAGELRASSWGIRYDVPDVPMPDLLPHLWSKKVLAADARAGLAAGDRGRVLKDARALAALRRALEREPLIVCQLIAMSVELAHHELIQQLLLSDLADAPTLDQLAGQLDGTGGAGRSLRATFAADTARMIDSVDATLIDEGRPWQRLRNAPERIWAPMEYASVIDLYYRLAMATEMPVPKIQRYLSSNVSPTPGVRIIAEFLIPNLVDGVEKSRASASVRRLAGLAIAARLHALVHGAYPDSLESFAGADLPDPYSGGALAYESRSDGSVVISFPDGAALWQREQPSSPHYQPRFVWRLPVQ